MSRAKNSVSKSTRPRPSIITCWPIAVLPNATSRTVATGRSHVGSVGMRKLTPIQRLRNSNPALVRTPSGSTWLVRRCTDWTYGSDVTRILSL